MSSLAYVVAGLVLVVLRRRLPDSGRVAVAGGLLVAVGVGSSLYHGPAPPGAQFVHDATIGALLGFLAWWSAPRLFSRWWWLVGAGAGIAALGIAPATSGPVLALAGATAAAAFVVRLGGLPEARVRLAAVVLMAVAAGAAATFGSTDGPWCDPDSPLQAHAAWHVLSAAALTLAVTSLATTQARSRHRGASVPHEVKG